MDEHYKYVEAGRKGNPRKREQKRWKEIDKEREREKEIEMEERAREIDR